MKLCGSLVKHYYGLDMAHLVFLCGEYTPLGKTAGANTSIYQENDLNYFPLSR